MSVRAVSVVWVVVCICLVRGASALLSGWSVFNPDEYWQSLEVAYNLVFGGGFIPWEFQSHAAIRGWLHPCIFAALYWLLRVLHLDTAWSIAVAPRLLQALLAGVGDWYAYLLAARLFGRRASQWMLFLTLSSWFFFFSLTRTLSNALECSLTIAALFHFPNTSARPFPDAHSDNINALAAYYRHRHIALVLAAVTFVVRPTSALIWLFLGAVHLVALPSLGERVRCVVLDVLPVGVAALLPSLTFDTLLYNRDLIGAFLTGQLERDALVAQLQRPLVSLNFVRLNSGTHLSALYGTHPLVWYFTEGIATLLGIVLPVFAYALYRFLAGRVSGGSASTRRSMRVLLAVALFLMVVLSMNAHKEPRFLLPVVPHVAFLLVSHWMADTHTDDGAALTSHGSTATNNHQQQATSKVTETSTLRQRHGKGATAVATAAVPSTAPTASTSQSPRRHKPVYLLALLILLGNVLMGAYFTCVHQSGPARVMEVLREQAHAFEQRCNASAAAAGTTDECAGSLSVHFLTNCHSMPLYSHLHQRGRQPNERTLNLHFLDCSPLFVGGELHGNGSNACSASSQFARTPLSFVRSYFAPAPLADGRSFALTMPAVARTCMWPWYASEDYSECLQQRMGLDTDQQQRINNEWPGGSVYVRASSTPAAVSASSVCAATPRSLPQLLVLDERHAEELQPFFVEHGYRLLQRCFHAHLDDTKAYNVFTRMA